MTGATSLISGISGFAGGHLAEHCLSCGDEVAGVSRTAPAVQGVRWSQADLTDVEATDALIREAAPDWVFHLAAEASVRRSWEDPTGIIDHNIRSTLNLLEALRRFSPDTRVMLACSGEEYGPPERLPVTEDHPLRPQNPYAVSKAAIDLLGGFYQDAHGLRIYRMRAFNHAGPGQTDTYVVPSLARQIAEAEALGSDGPAEIAIGNSQVRRDFTDVRDVVCAYRMALERAEPGVYNVCSGEATMIADVLAGLASHATVVVEQRTDSDLVRRHEVMEIRGSHDRLTDATGWQPEISLDETLRDTLDWWRSRIAAGVTT